MGRIREDSVKRDICGDGRVVAVLDSTMAVDAVFSNKRGEER